MRTMRNLAKLCISLVGYDLVVKCYGTIALDIDGRT